MVHVEGVIPMEFLSNDIHAHVGTRKPQYTLKFQDQTIEGIYMDKGIDILRAHGYGVVASETTEDGFIRLFDYGPQCHPVCVGILYPLTKELGQ